MTTLATLPVPSAVPPSVASLADPLARDRLVASFRRGLYAVIDFTWLHHQAEWQLAGEGWTLVPSPPTPGDHYTTILTPDPTDRTFASENRVQRTTRVRQKVVPRPGGAAHHLANLAAFKGGKSYGGAAFLTGYAILPDATVGLVGMEYGICEHEFNYLIEFLCAEPPRGMNLKYRQLLNDKRGGRMRLALKPLMPGGPGAVFECKSWERKEGLKGAKIDCYYFCEAYQFPDLSCFTSISQNLRQRKGRAVWTTTPDEPWVQYLHDKGHDPEEPDWHCTCGADDRANPFTFDQKARDRDDPDKNGIMTRERFEIAHNGRLGTFVGRVYSYSRGSKLLTPETYPAIWKD